MTLSAWMRRGGPQHRNRIGVIRCWVRRQQQETQHSQFYHRSCSYRLGSSSTSSSNGTNPSHGDDKNNNKKKISSSSLSPRPLKPWQLMDRTLRGIGQVPFVNCPHAGLVLLAGMALHNPFSSVLAATGSATANTVAHIATNKGWIGGDDPTTTSSSSNSNSNQKELLSTKKKREERFYPFSLSGGYCGYNGCLIGCATGAYITPIDYSPLDYSENTSLLDSIQYVLTSPEIMQMIFSGTCLTIAGASVTPFLMDQLHKKYSSLLLAPPPTTSASTTTSSNTTSTSNNNTRTTAITIAKKTTDNGDGDNNNNLYLPQFLLAYNLVSIPMITLLSSVPKPDIHMSLDQAEYIVALWFNTSICGVSQIFCMDQGVAMGTAALFGISYYSPMLASYAFLGSGVGAITGGYMCNLGLLGAGVYDVSMGYWSYNSALVGLGIGYYFQDRGSTTMFFVMGSSVPAALIYGLFTHYIPTIPCLTLPFCITMTGCYILGPKLHPALQLAKKPHSPERNVIQPLPKKN